MGDEVPCVAWNAGAAAVLRAFLSDRRRRHGYYFRVIKCVTSRYCSVELPVETSFGEQPKESVCYWFSLGRKGFGEILFLKPILARQESTVCAPLVKECFNTLRLQSGRFSLTNAVLSILSATFANSPAIVVISNGAKSQALADREWFSSESSMGCHYVCVPHFSKCKILSESDRLASEFESKATDNESRMFFLQTCAPNTVAYNIPMCLYLTSLDHTVITAEDISCFVTKLLGSSSLRTVYFLTASGVMKKVLPLSAFPNTLSISVLPNSLDEARVALLAKSFHVVLNSVFNLNSSVFSAYLVSVKPHEVLLILNFHHIAVDGVSIKTLLQQACGHVRKPSAVEQDALNGCSRCNSALLQQWGSALDGIDFSSSFPRFRNLNSNCTCGNLNIQVGNAQFIGSLKSFAKLMQVSVSSVLSLAFGLALCIVHNCDSILLGYVKTGRSTLRSQDSVGFFVETLPLVVKTSPKATFSSLLESIHQKLILIHDSHIKLKDLIPVMNPPHGRHGKDMFNYFLVYQDVFRDMPDQVNIRDKDWKCEPWFADSLQAQAELSLEVVPGESLVFKWKYDQQRLDQELVTFIHCLTTEIMYQAFQLPSYCVDPWIAWMSQQNRTPPHLRSGIIGSFSEDLCLDTVSMPLPEDVVCRIGMLTENCGVLPCVVYSLALCLVLSAHSDDSTVSIAVGRQYAECPGMSFHQVPFIVSASLNVEQALVAFSSLLIRSAVNYLPLSLVSHSCKAFVVDIMDFLLEEDLHTPVLLEMCTDGLEWTFRSRHYDPCGITGHFLSTLMYILSNTSTSVSQIPLCTPTEEHFLTAEVNDTHMPFSETETAMILLHESLISHSEQIAMVCSNEYMSYGELLLQLHLAMRHLAQAGAVCGSRIAVYLNRGFDLFVYTTAIMYTGAVYIPLPNHSPVKRLSQICSGADVCIVVTQSSALVFLEECRYLRTCRVVCVDACAVCSAPGSFPLPSPKADDVAYVIHTSGTTGVPKGVCVTHLNLRNLLVMVEQILPRENTAFARVGIDTSFDPHLLEYLPTLIAGGCCVIVEDIAHSCFPATYIVSTPSAAAVCHPTKEVKTAIVGGEALTSAQHSLLKSVPHVVNAYGPSECTVLCTANTRVDRDNTVNIGSPLANVKCFILSQHNQVCPLGSPGVLYIGGHCVSRGYLNDLEKTQQVFVEVEIVSSDKTMYCTGDVVKMNANGTLNFVGRQDTQVKLRGFRLELSEVEAALVSVEPVQDAVAVVKDMEGGMKVIIAFVTPKEVCVSEIKEELSTILPSYMLPYMIIPVDQIKLTIQGKVDKQFLLNLQLSERKGTEPSSSSDSVVSNSEELSLVKKLFISLLKVNSVSDHDNFYELGGDSLLAVQFANMLSERVETTIHASTVIGAPTPAELANKISIPYRKRAQVKQALPVEEVFESNALSPRQWVYYLLQSMSYDARAYTTNFSFKLNGVVDRDKAYSAGQALLKRLGLQGKALCEGVNGPCWVVESEVSDLHSALPLTVLSLSQPIPNSIQIDISLHRIVYDSFNAISRTQALSFLVMSYLGSSSGECDVPISIGKVKFAEAVESCTDVTGFAPEVFSWSTKLGGIDYKLAPRLLLLLLHLMWKQLGENIVIHCIASNGETKVYNTSEFASHGSKSDSKQCVLANCQKLTQSSNCNTGGDLLLYSFPPTLSYHSDRFTCTLQQTMPTFSEYAVSIGIIVEDQHITFVMSYNLGVYPSMLLPPQNVIDFLSHSFHFLSKEPNATIPTLLKVAKPYLDLESQAESNSGASLLNGILATRKFDFEFFKSGIEIWESLGCRNRLTEENFHTCASLQMAVKSRLGILIPLQTLLLAPSKSALCSSLSCLFFLSQQNAPPVQTLLSSTVKTNAEIHIFCFPELSGYPWIYQNIALFACHRLSVLHYSKEVLSTATSFWDIVSALVSEILITDSSGPYYLMGYSFGAVLAYTASCILTSRGKCVKSIVFLDGSPLIAHSISERVEFEWIWNEKMFFQHMCMSSIALQSCPFPPGQDLKLQCLPWCPLSCSDCCDLLLRLAVPLRLASKLEVHHARAKVQGILIKAPGHAILTSRDYGLENLCQLSVYELQSVDHFTMMDECGARQIAAIVNSSLLCEPPSNP